MAEADPDNHRPTLCKSATVKHPSEASLLRPFGHEKTGDVVSVNSPRSITSRISGRPLVAQHHPDYICKDTVFPFRSINLEQFSLRMRVSAPKKHCARIMRPQCCASDTPTVPREHNARAVPRALISQFN